MKMVDANWPSYEPIIITDFFFHLDIKLGTCGTDLFYLNLLVIRFRNVEMFALVTKK